MQLHEFERLAAQGFNRIPVVRQVLADVDTPVSSYMKLANGPYSYLLEAVEGGEKRGRYSMIGLPCSRVIKVFDHDVVEEIDGVEVKRETVDDPLAYIDSVKDEFRVAPIDEVSGFSGGLVGYFAYDTVRYAEKRLADSTPPSQIGCADIVLMVSEKIMVFDNLAGTLSLVILADPQQENALDSARSALDGLYTQLRTATFDLPELNIAALKQDSTDLEASFDSSFGQTAYEKAVEDIKEYILAGDCMQVVISQRLSRPFNGDPLSLYRALRLVNPSPYMYFMNLGDTHVVGSSPEILARMVDRKLVVRPLAGTRRRGHTEAEDLALEKELLADPKEVAEHLMLIDLGRNDIGRVAKTGSVKVTEQMDVERYSHVMHIVSNVEGDAKDDLTALGLLRSALPAGTLSGAPKVRAMEIIDEFEPIKREVFGGAVGYISWDGNMDVAIAIRTAVIKDGQLHVQAGAGVVADSVPALEWKETMNKARAVIKAVAMVEEA
ncbi:Anthranilate synthase component 1 [BD1-7 clade bacterium]|uniref:Anthranilate synthase component 1 n=1 Tax=BD1-7 clade bacterium TaxID=2029982 RepID=A0A5S9QWB2_9GAMM|nr:Anthranilate synthase component 1 [BD1-7 clade bacterium]